MHIPGPFSPVPLESRQNTLLKTLVLRVKFEHFLVSEQVYLQDDQLHHIDSELFISLEWQV
jgi:hypothetical protein